MNRMATGAVPLARATPTTVTDDPPRSAPLPGLTVRLLGVRGFEAAVVEEVDGDVVTVRTAGGGRRAMPVARVSLSTDARTRRLVALAASDPDAARREREDYLARWRRDHPVARAHRTPRDPRALGREILAVVEAAPVPVSRAGILAAVPVDTLGDYDRAMQHLVQEGRVERVGSAGGTRYQTAAHTLFPLPPPEPARGG